MSLVFVLACSPEYRVGKIIEAEVPSNPTTPTTSATTPVVDTATTPPVDTGTPPIADAPVYAHTASELFEIDPASGARTRVGAFQEGGAPITTMVDIAIDLGGRMYGGTYDALYQVDPHTAALSRVCTTDLGPYALAFTSDGLLYAGAGDQVVEVGLPGCATTPLVHGTAYETSGDLVGLPDGYLYWTVRADGHDDLVKVDPFTGATFWIGAVDAEKLFGLGYDQGELYGFSSSGRIVRIDPGSGATSDVFTDTTSWWGATTNPVVW